MENLDVIAERIRQDFEARNAARDEALRRSRELIRYCANTIRATHRAEFEEASQLLATAHRAASELVECVADYPDLYYAGYTQDALKELAEASITYALITDGPLPDPDDLNIEYPAYLNGLGEAVGELRRYVLDIIRRGQIERGEEILSAMDDIYAVLVTMDFSDAITGGLRRTTDMVRGVLERTRGDLTIAIRQDKLQEALRAFEERVNANG
ncbi:MAG: haloacid dehalogenase [Anaerolineae bacterium]